ncbi:hypothetical protein [Actinophytocola sediminis]
MTVLELLSWVIGLANPISAALVGPALARLLTRLGVTRWIFRAQGAGWLVLAIAQLAFLTFGYAAGFPGFQYAQPLMIPIAGLNFLAWLLTRRRPRPDNVPRDPPRKN